MPVLHFWRMSCGIRALALIVVFIATTSVQAQFAGVNNFLKPNEKSRASELGRKIKWRQMGFETNFFGDWETLNASGDLEPESPKSKGYFHNDTIVVALDGWQQIEDFPHSEAMDLDVQEIRSAPVDDIIHFRERTFVSAQDNQQYEYILAFFNMQSLSRFKEKCRPHFIYEFVRLVGKGQDRSRFAWEYNSFHACEYG